MEHVEFLLSEEFIRFSKKIEELAIKKKELKEELKEFYNKINEQIKDLEVKAKEAQQEFEDWKASNVKKSV